MKGGGRRVSACRHRRANPHPPQATCTFYFVMLAARGCWENPCCSRSKRYKCTTKNLGSGVSQRPPAPPPQDKTYNPYGQASWPACWAHRLLLFSSFPPPQSHWPGVCPSDVPGSFPPCLSLCQARRSLQFPCGSLLLNLLLSAQTSLS